MAAHSLAEAAGSGAASSSKPGVLDSKLDLISARLEGLALRSEAGTAVRACRSGEAARTAATTPWKWTPRDPSSTAS